MESFEEMQLAREYNECGSHFISSKLIKVSRHRVKVVSPAPSLSRSISDPDSDIVLNHFKARFPSLSLALHLGRPGRFGFLYLGL